MGRLEQSVFQTDLTTRRHSHTTNYSRTKIGQDVAKHVLHHQHIVFPWLPDKIKCHRVDVLITHTDVREQPRTLVKYLSEKCHRTKHVRLVDTRHCTGQPTAFSIPCKIK